MHIVYCHTCLTNGKRYVGVTPLAENVVKDPTLLMQKRWQRHVYDAMKRNLQFPFHCAIRKHTEDRFEHEVLEVCDSLERAFEREIFWIAEKASQTSKHGYNVKAGGNGCRPSPYVNQRKSEGLAKRWAVVGARERHSATMKSVAATQNYRETLSEAMIKVSNRPEEKARRAEIARSKFSKPITQKTVTGDTVAEFSSATAAAEATGLSCRLIKLCANKKRQNVGDFVWSWK